jgi:hypothetical protein
MAGILSVSDVFDRVKRQFGDESAVQVSEADIIRWINDAQREAVMQNEGLLMKDGYITSVAGQKEYDLPVDLFTIQHVYYRDTLTTPYYALKWLGLKQFSEFLDGWDGASINSYPHVYTSQESNKIVIYPAPQTAVTNGIKIIYSHYAEDVVDSGDPLGLPPYLHSYVVKHCLMQAYEMDEDWEAAGQMASQVQGDLDFNNNRQFWFGRESYPSVSTTYDDMD